MPPFAKFLSLLQLNRISGKLAITIATLLVPTLIMGYLLYNTVHAQVVFVNNERIGTEYLGVVRQAASQTIEYRRLLAEHMTGTTVTKAQLDRKFVDVEAAIKAMDAMEAKLNAELPGQTYTPKVFQLCATELAEAKKSLESIQTKDRTKATEALNGCDNLLLALRSLMTEVANASQLTLDPVYVSYACQSITLYQIVDADLTGKIVWRAMVDLAYPDVEGRVSIGTLSTINRLLGEQKLSADTIASSLSLMYADKRETEANVMNGKLTTWRTRQDEFAKYVDANLLSVDKPTATPTKLVSLANSVAEADYAVIDTALPMLDTELLSRYNGFRTDLTLGFVISIFGVLLAIGLAYLMTRSFTRQIRAFLQLFVAVDHGDYAVRVDKLTNDELGEMTVSLNQVLATTDTLIQKQKAEYSSLQASIMKLLEEVSSAADGDLTMQAEVSADATGAIADSFNYTIEQLRKIISRVQVTTIEVANAASQMDEATQKLANGSENQASQIMTVTAAIDNMAATIQKVSDNASLSATVAQQALQNARQGNTAVRDTIDGMTRIREQTQETAKRLKRLGETSQEIGQIVQLIDDIADRTGILALNASIQAAAAGDAGRGFAVVAEEVERLAVRSADATKKIAVLVRAIQGETSESVAAMERNIQEVVGGSKVAQQAGVSLAEIEGVSVKLAELIQSISVASKQQARGSEELARSMVGISEITQQTAVGTKQTAESVNGLTRLAEALRGSVSTFKLPEDMMPENIAPVTSKPKASGNANAGPAANGAAAKADKNANSRQSLKATSIF